MNGVLCPILVMCIEVFGSFRFIFLGCDIAIISFGVRTFTIGHV